VEPLQPPMTLEQTTKYLSVSMALPGPIMLSHQPSFFRSTGPLAASAPNPVSAALMPVGSALMPAA